MFNLKAITELRLTCNVNTKRLPEMYTVDIFE